MSTVMINLEGISVMTVLLLVISSGQRGVIFMCVVIIVVESVVGMVLLLVNVCKLGVRCCWVLCSSRGVQLRFDGSARKMR